MGADCFIAAIKTVRTAERTARKLAVLSLSGAPTTEDFRGNASSLADNFSAEQQKQPAAPEGWLSGSRR
jgi:hypothetical protein